MALDQLMAVFWPFTHVRLRRNLNRVMFAVVGVLLGVLAVYAVVLVVLEAPPDYFRITYMIMGLVCVGVLLVVYPTTAYKLYRRSLSVQPKPQPRQRSGGLATQNKRKTSNLDLVPKGRMHVQALKIYSAILLQFMLSTLFCVVGDVVFNQRWVVYVFFFNHIGNPVIYYCFVPKFRESVKASARFLCHSQGRF